MTKKDYILLAEAIGKGRDAVLTYHLQANSSYETVKSEMMAINCIVDYLSDALESDNPLFNRYKFEEHIENTQKTGNN